MAFHNAEFYNGRDRTPMWADYEGAYVEWAKHEAIGIGAPQT